MHMTSLMCSTDRQEVETLRGRLLKAGIRSEIGIDPRASKLGLALFEIFVDEGDLLTASKVREDLETVASADDAPGSPRGGRTINGFVKGKGLERVPEVEVLPTPSAESLREESPGHEPQTAGAGPEGEFAQTTALLEQQFACVEKKLTEICEARAFLEKEMRALEVRFKASEQALAASQARLESQKREFSDQQARIVNLEKEVSSRDAQLEGTAESLAQARAEIEQEKVLRLAAEQKSGELVAGLKSIEGQLAQQARHREQLLDERRNEQEQMRVCVDKVNAFCGRVTAILATREKQ